MVGTLVADEGWGLALMMGDQKVGVIWPYGFSAQREQGRVLLLDQNADVVAREGDMVSMDNPVTNGQVTPCLPLEVLPRPS